MSSIAQDPAQFVTFLMNEELALDTFEPLSAEPPDPVVTIGTVGLSVEPLGLKDVTIHLVHLPPSPRAPETMF